jgi:bifunctional non-homologous end joining protein LigD
LKHKYTATLSAVVERINAQRSVALKLRGMRGWQTTGNVTIPANQPLPQPGDVVEVRYLYAFQKSGVLFQPVCLGVRTDITAAECGTGQMKFKPSDTDEDA